MADGIQAANQAAIARIGSNGYDSDDDIGESEAMQAENLHSSLRDRLAKTDEQLHDQWLQDSERDYAQNASVLDQDIVSQKLEQLKVFAEHLHWAGKNRAGLLARMVEPLAENHWLIEPEFHQQFVDTFRGMGNLVNNLPDIAKAATAASQASGLLEQDSAESARQEKARQIAQIERLIHQVEQADEWFKSDSWGGFELTSFVSKTA
ncbi:hypothetical protein FBU59_001887 [Linderina macrospora]|uniref:Uncharacterized protein n=1 Tax=Linderina macrospora TaxID=4868 RepID=A0ACC1JCJ8_9FUNG|nr:hypothetical protein FBU59_001887 [Linderina macrospora]